MIAMGFVGLHEYLQRAERAFAAGDGGSRAVALDAAFRVVEHLLVALDQNSKAEGISNLTDLYLFLLDRISRANIFNDPELLAECRPVVENLREAWTQIADNADR
jgi:flagellar protein FliS